MEEVTIYFKKITENAIIPEYKTREAAGFDISSNEDFTLEPNTFKTIKTGLAVELPIGYELQIRSRSGLASKHGISVLNSPGTVDSDYRGEIKIILMNHGSHKVRFQKGDRIAQGIVNKLPIVTIKESKELSETERGENGFGSTGIK